MLSIKLHPLRYINAGTKALRLQNFAPQTTSMLIPKQILSMNLSPLGYIIAGRVTLQRIAPPSLCPHTARNSKFTIESYALVLHKILGPNVRMLRMSRIQEILYKKALVLTDFIEEIPWRMRNPKSISRPKKAATPTNSHPHMKDFNVQEGGQTKAATPTNTHWREPRPLQGPRRRPQPTPIPCREARQPKKAATPRQPGLRLH